MRIDDLSPLQLQVFEAFKLGESLTRMELKERLNITVRSTLARIISRLEVFGLLEKTEDVPGRIQLTPQGERLLQCKQKEDTNKLNNLDVKFFGDVDSVESKKDSTDNKDDNEYDVIPKSFRDKELLQQLNKDEEPICSVEIRDDIEWLRQLSLDVACRVKNETDLNRISVWSRAASDLANTYSMLSFNELSNLTHGFVNSGYFGTGE